MDGPTSPAADVPPGEVPPGDVSPADVSPAERTAMSALRRCLDESAYAVLHQLAAGGQKLVADPRAALALAGAGPEWSLYRLLGLGTPVAPGELAPPARAAAGSLLKAGLLLERDGLLASAGWIVVPALRGFLLTGLPPTHGGEPGASAYLGEDSFRLADVLPDVAGRRVLDVGSGCGIQGLLACRGAAEAVLTDVDPSAVHVMALNAVLNDVTVPLRLLAGSLYRPVAGERFDLVVSLPPYLPEVPGSGVTRAAGGGPDGLDVLAPLLSGATEALRDGGELYALAQLLCDDDGPLLFDLLPASTEALGIELFCSDRHPLRPWIGEVAERLARHHAGLSAGELATAYGESLRSLGASGVCTAVVRARAGAGGRRVVLGPAGAVLPASVLRHAGPISAGPAALEAVVLEGRAPAHLDALGMALLRSIDGQRDLSEAAAAGWGEPDDADWRDIEEMAAWRAGELLRSGLVVLEPEKGDVVFAPFEPALLAELSRRQVAASPASSCPSGDGGVLAAEPDGWRCPICGARQTWALAVEPEPEPEVANGS